VIEWVTILALSATGIFSYMSSQYLTAVVCAACAGFCLGLATARYFVRRW